jgi:hypothetical protein
MPAEKASEFEAGIAGRAENRGFKFGRHQTFFKYARSLRFLIVLVEAYLSIMMHKYSYILTGLAELSSRNRGSRLFGSWMGGPMDRQDRRLVKMKGESCFESFSDGCKKKYLLDSVDRRI